MGVHNIMVKVCIQSVAHEKFVCGDPDGNSICDRDAVGPWETHKFKDHDDDDNKVGFKSSSDKWLSAQPDGKCDFGGEDLNEWEYFTVEQAGDGKVYLKGAHDKYLSAQPDGTIDCSGEEPKEWEQFRIMVAFTE